MQSCAVMCVLCTGSHVQSYASCALAVMCSHMLPVHRPSCAVICVLCTGSHVQSYASCAPAVICRHLVQLPLSHLVKLPLEACHAFGFAVSIQGCAIKSPTHAIPTHDPRCSPQPPQLLQVSPGEPVQGAAAFRRRRPWGNNHEPRVQSRRRLPPGL